MECLLNFLKRIKNSNLFSTTILMLSIFCIIAFVGCEKENLFVNTYEEYLELNSYELSEMSEEDFNTICKALQRLDIYKQNGLYCIKQRCGAEVNISEELYNFIKEGFENTNKLMRSKPVSFSITRLKNGGENGNQPPTNQTPTDCVAHALAGMGGVSYEVANTWIIQNYGTNGVPASAIDSVVKHFYPTATSTKIPYGMIMNNAFIYYKTSDTTGHAVNGYLYDASSGYIMFKDHQNLDSLGNPKPGIIHVDSVINIYYK